MINFVRTLVGWLYQSLAQHSLDFLDDVPQTIILTAEESYPHDPTWFTQGLCFHKGVLFESTGMNGQSHVSKVDLHSGKTHKSYNWPTKYFGEGITILNDQVYALTWKSREVLLLFFQSVRYCDVFPSYFSSYVYNFSIQVFVLDVHTLEVIKTFKRLRTSKGQG